MTHEFIINYMANYMAIRVKTPNLVKNPENFALSLKISSKIFGGLIYFVYLCQ